MECTETTKDFYDFLTKNSLPAPTRDRAFIFDQHNTTIKGVRLTVLEGARGDLRTEILWLAESFGLH